MQRRLNFFQIFVGFIFLFTAIYKISPSGKSEEILKIELKKELKNGNFLIGLKQYLGGKNDSFSKNNNISFLAEKGYLNLHSHNGIKVKSKKINIIWKEIPLRTPYVLERFVFGPYASYESAQKKVRNLREKGLEATVAYPKDWEVWVPTENKIPINIGNYKIFKEIKKSQIIPFLSNNYTFQKLEGPIYISSNQNLIINNINFGKRFYIAKDLYGTWTLIQQIKFDDYLKGVLPYEIGSNSPIEALKAQAVIARTWALFNSNRFSMDQYHLCITTQCQVYKTPKVENEKVQKAVKETSNLIITYENKPINSFYHGSNGGISAGSSESWKIRELPYLQTKIDGTKSLGKSLELPIQDDSELENFFALERKEFFGSNHSLFRWNKKISNLIIKKTLIKNNQIDTNEEILDLKVKERGISGRVTKLEIKLKNTNNVIVLLKDDIRQILSFLPSNLFTINKLNNNLWIFRGGGFGHGVGLSQAGAIEMAELGFTYEQILNHYYSSTKLKEIGILSQ